jgi:predicted phosphoribosyltransferase
MARISGCAGEEEEEEEKEEEEEEEEEEEGEKAAGVGRLVIIMVVDGVVDGTTAGWDVKVVPTVSPSAVVLAI